MLQAGLHNSRRASVRITEVSPRDGLQHEPEFVPTQRKISLINALSRTGLTEIEAGSFVSPAAVPQLADSDEVLRAIDRIPGVTYSALVPNERGLERARAAGVDKIAVFTAASDSLPAITSKQPCRNHSCASDPSWRQRNETVWR